MGDEQREVVITLGPTRRGNSNEARLERELRTMRRGGFELELFMRGTWQREHGGVSREHAEKRIEQWHWDGVALRVADEVGSWMPATNKKPLPEIVLRGTRRS